MFEVIPAVDIRGGRCVRLYQGDYERETVFSADPVATALRWAEAGAPRLHVVDLDGARDGPENASCIERIVRESPIPVQVGGGIRSADAAARWLDRAGADRVILGTLAFVDRAAVGGLAARYGGRVVVALDVREGLVRTRGWLDSSGTTAAEALRALAALGVQRFLYTNIARDGTLEGPDLEGIGALLAAAPPGVRVIASGGVSSVEDVDALARLPLEGVIVGRALYDGRIDLEGALEAARRAAPA